MYYETSSPSSEQALSGLRELRKSGAIAAISIDLDDTLWPVWPAIARAEQVLLDWLGQHAPATAAALGDKAAVRAVREQVERERPDLAHDLSGLRRESIRFSLLRSGDDPALAEPAFDVFFAQRQRVDLFDDAVPALRFLASRWPVVALSNGNASVHAVGIGEHFHASLSASMAGMAKPDVRFFQAAAKAAGVEPGKVLHIGDDARLDALGAMDAGMHAVWLNRTGLAWPQEGRLPHFTVASLEQLCRGLADS
ncbi:HAD family hydrolase [Comamonas composti]|uniref:HAD family hydrolase n=1 Tax=Comamonas composti TaxID=408558 RepID=UPI0004044E19|nr:HAD family hydrolase [Comamonas composti]